MYGIYERMQSDLNLRLLHYWMSNDSNLILFVFALFYVTLATQEKHAHNLSILLQE